MIKSSEIKEIYSNLQEQLFYLIPEKWDRIYLYASVEEKMAGLETGELFFYYFPKGILKKNPINVYEIPIKFNLNEDEYINLVEKLYKDSNYSNIDRHIIWRYKNLGLPDESFTKKEMSTIRKYINETIYFNPDIETYTESIYKRPVKRKLKYNREIKEPEYVHETEFQKLEKQAKGRFEEQRYTYKVTGRRKLKNIYEKGSKEKQKTYVEQIEEQRERVRSQILNHI